MYILSRLAGQFYTPSEVDDYDFMSDMSPYGCDFSLITLNPDVSIEKAEFGGFPAKGGGRKREQES